MERSPGENRDGEQAATRLETVAQRLYGHSSAELRRRGAEAGRLEEQSRLVALLAIVASLLVSLAVAGFASLRIARPLRELRASASDVARRKATEPIPVRGRDEIADLTIAFNRMADRLRELDSLKQHLFSAITHDLRTPLTVIAWSAERLGRGEAGMPRDAPGVTRREHPDEHGPAPGPGHARSSISASSEPASSSSISIPLTSTP